MAGLVPAIHDFVFAPRKPKKWMPVTVADTTLFLTRRGLLVQSLV